MERRFHRDVRELDSIFRFVSEFFARSGLEQRSSFEVELILEELFTNLVKYNHGRHDIAIRLGSAGEDAVEIVLVDRDVEPFDITRAPPPPDTGRPLAERRAGGLGLHLVRQMSDALRYEHEGGTTTITVTKRVFP